jgi:hypothetical protein
MRHPYPVHGRRWTWRHPLSWTCRCGLDAWPCIVVRQQRRAYADALRAVQGWRDRERRDWPGAVR